MYTRFVAVAGLVGVLISGSTVASAGDNRNNRNRTNKAIARLQADIRRDEAALAAAQRAGDRAAIAREQADLARDRARLQQLQAGVRVTPRPATLTERGKHHKHDRDDEHGKKGKKHHRGGDRERDDR